MQTLTVEIKNENALKVLQDLQEKHHIEIRSRLDLNSLIFPGKPMTADEFKAMIENAENSGSMTFNEAKSKWASQRKRLQKFAK